MRERFRSTSDDSSSIREKTNKTCQGSDDTVQPPPSFAESEFHQIQRHQKQRRGNVLKWSNVPSRYPNLNNSWEFAGWGSTYYMEIEKSDIDVYEQNQREIVKIGQWGATSIAGNDLIASVLYSIGPCVVQSGKYAPISMLLIALLMYPVKRVITEVVTAMPLNGGTYNAMLNSVSKSTAVICACLSILNYLATSVVSASTASAYLAAEVELPARLTPFVLTIVILIVFSLIRLLGLKESSTLTLSIFSLHALTMTVVLAASIIMWGKRGSQTLIDNWTKVPDPEGSNPVLLIAKGVCIGLLSVTGFESAENYVEDLKPGTFPKVMNNMFGFLFALNAPMTLVCTVLVPITVLQANSANAVSALGEYAAGGGRWLRLWIMVDAVIVLCAGVLTGLTGAVGMIQRMASDNILPKFFLTRNRFTRSYQYIILTFLVLSITLYAIVGGDTSSLSGVFAVAFSGSLSTFAVANIMIKYKRGRLSRVDKVSLPTALFVFCILLASLIGNIVIEPMIARFFVTYFAVVLVVVLAMMERCWLLKLCYWLVDQMNTVQMFSSLSEKLEAFFRERIKKIRTDPIVFFLKTDEPHVMNKAIHYIKKNEDTGQIKLIHIYRKFDDIPGDLEAHHRLLDELYPKIQIDLIFIQGKFNPATVDSISRQMGIAKSRMCMACPGKYFGEFGGVRIIMLNRFGPSSDESSYSIEIKNNESLVYSSVSLLSVNDPSPSTSYGASLAARTEATKTGALGGLPLFNDLLSFTSDDASLAVETEIIETEATGNRVPGSPPLVNDLLSFTSNDASLAVETEIIEIEATGNRVPGSPPLVNDLLSFTSGDASLAAETEITETGATEVQAPQVQAPEVQAPQVQDPQVQAPQVQAPEVQDPQVQAPEVQDPQVQAPILCRLCPRTFTSQRRYRKHGDTWH